MKAKIISLMSALFLAAGIVFAQGADKLKLTVEDAVQYALSNNYSLRSGAIDTGIKKRVNANAWNTLLPQVSVGAMMLRSNELNGGTADMMKSAGESPSEADRWTAVLPSVNFSWSFNPATVYDMKVIRSDYEAGLITQAEAQSQTELAVRKMFYSLLAAEESLKLQEESLENARERAEQAAINFRNGRIAEYVLLQAQASYQNQRPQTLKARQSLEAGYNSFVLLLGMKAGTKIAIQGSITPVYQSYDTVSLDGEYIASGYDYLLLAKNIESLGIQKKSLAMQAFLPSFQLDWNLQPLYSLSSKAWYADSVKGENGGLSLTLAWNLTNLLPLSSARQGAEDIAANISKLRVSMEELTEQKRNNVVSLVNMLELSRSQISALEANAALSQNAYDATVRSYQAGACELLEVRDAENSLNVAKLALLYEEYNYVSGALDLEFALNKKSQM